jgi:hypothetical protein
MDKKILKLLFILLLLSCPLRAQSSRFETSGYIKYLSSVSDYPGIEGKLYDQLIHTRIDTAWYPSDSLRGELDLRFRFFYGDSVDKIPQFSEAIKTSYDFTSLGVLLWDGSKSVGYGQVDRLWLDYTKNDLEITVGRQRIAWGTCLVWNVIDLFNPKSVLDFDYEEKPGVDAIRIQYYTGAVSKTGLSVRPGKDMENSTLAWLYSVNISGYDIYGIAGIRDNRWLAGGAWAGSVLGGGFRGELLLSQSPAREVPDDNSLPPVSDNSFFASDRPVASFVVSGDYTFPNSFYILTECLYNSNGKQENAGLYHLEAIDADMLSPARWSIYQEFSYDINPLTRATLFGIYNPDDHSFIIVPELSRSLSNNLDLLLIGFLPSGKKNTEFGVYRESINMRLKYSF